MNDIVLSLIVLVFVGAIIGLIFILVAAQKKKRESALRNLASLNGWRYEPVEDRTTSGWRFHKGDWMIEALNLSSTNSSDTSTASTVSQTRWFSEAVHMTDGIVLVGPHQPEIGFGGIGEMVMQAALRLMIGSEAENAAGIQRLELGDAELMSRYMVWTNREEIANKLLDRPLINTLQSWPLKTPPVIKYSPAGLEIKIQGLRMAKETDLYALVKLGNMLIESAR